jgi:hypothetical protein
VEPAFVRSACRIQSSSHPESFYPALIELMNYGKATLVPSTTAAIEHSDPDAALV